MIRRKDKEKTLLFPKCYGGFCRNCPTSLSGEETFYIRDADMPDMEEIRNCIEWNGHVEIPIENRQGKMHKYRRK